MKRSAPKPGREEVALVAALKAGDPRAYETIVRDYGPRMLAAAKRFLADEAAALDAVQDAFLSAFRSVGRFKGDAKLSTWLHRIVVNSALQILRSRKRRPETTLDGLLPSFTEDGHMATPFRAFPAEASTLAEDRETRELVRRTIDRLPDGHRVTLLLHDVEGLDTRETARVLGIAQSAVRVRLHRARLALRALLEPQFSGGRP